MSDYFRQNKINHGFSINDSWIILSSTERNIISKIELYGIPLKDWDISINYGIKTGLNEAFIITESKKNELLKEDPKSAEIIRPILRGRDIKRYGYNFAETYVILAYYGSYKILEKEYPAVYKHLLQYERQLKSRGQCRYTSSGKISNNIDFQGQHHWLELDNNLSLQKLEDFYKQKIIWGEISDKTKFAIDLEGKFFNEATTFLMVGKSLLFLVGYLNSKVSEYFFSKIGTTTGVGTVRWKKFTIEQLLVPRLNNDDQMTIEKLVLKIISSFNDETKLQDLNKELNEIIYNVFKFSSEEIDFIESQ